MNISGDHWFVLCLALRLKWYALCHVPGCCSLSLSDWVMVDSKSAVDDYGRYPGSDCHHHHNSSTSSSNFDGATLCLRENDEYIFYNYLEKQTDVKDEQQEMLRALDPALEDSAGKSRWNLLDITASKERCQWPCVFTWIMFTFVFLFFSGELLWSKEATGSTSKNILCVNRLKFNLSRLLQVNSWSYNLWIIWLALLSK